MASTKAGFVDTWVAAADLSSKQFRFVKISGAAGMDVVSGVTDKTMGVLQDKPVSGAEGLVMHSGRSKVVAGGTVAPGDSVGSDANGAAVAYANGTDTTKYIVGYCRRGGAAGELIEIVFNAITPNRGA